MALGLGAAAEDELEIEHDHDDFESLVVTRAAVENADFFFGKLCTVIGPRDVLRIKGFPDAPGRERRQLGQAAEDRLQRHFDRPRDKGEKRQTRLVVIGGKGLERAAITAALSG